MFDQRRRRTVEDMAANIGIESGREERRRAVLRRLRQRRSATVNRQISIARSALLLRSVYPLGH